LAFVAVNICDKTSKLGQPLEKRIDTMEVSDKGEGHDECGRGGQEGRGPERDGGQQVVDCR